MPTATAVDQEKTGLGNYFIANYPPFSYWKPQHLAAAQTALDSAPAPGTPLGLYLHIPFCRKRCKFCYFRVYTDKNAKDIEVYLDALLKEVSLLARKPAKVTSSVRALDQITHRRELTIPMQQPPAALIRNEGIDQRRRIAKRRVTSVPTLRNFTASREISKTCHPASGQIRASFIFLSKMATGATH